MLPQKRHIGTYASIFNGMFLLYWKPSARMLFSGTLSEEFDRVESPYTLTQQV